jgi:tetratricopeptide (TPR) repeat protein
MTDSKEYKDNVLGDINAMLKQANINELFQQAAIQFQQGYLDEALLITQRILSANPDHAGACHLLGLIVGQRGNLRQADQLITNAIKHSPSTAAYYSTHAHILLLDERLEEAAIACKMAIALNPSSADSYNNLGFILNQLGRAEEALIACNRAVELQPQFAAAHNNRANALGVLGRVEEALLSCDRAIMCQPDLIDAHMNRGNALKELGRLDEAKAAYEQIIAIKPDNAQAHCTLGIILWRQGFFEAALDSYEHATRINPDYVEAYSNLGLALRDLGRIEEAFVSLEHAIRLKPGYAEAHNNLGMVLLDLGRLKDAMVATERAIEIKPDYAIAHYNLGLLLLLTSDYNKGWREHEWRWEAMEIPAPGRKFHQPQWDGSPLTGRTILLIAEQGFGDTIQFIRYVPLLAKADCKIIVKCQKELLQLLSDLTEIDYLVKLGDPTPDFDVYAHLMSLPYILRTSLETIPNDCPYLSSPSLSAYIREQIWLTDTYKNIGIVWAGNPAHKNDRNRSVKLEMFRPLLRIPGVNLLSLQIGERVIDLEMNQDMREITDTSPYITSFYDTASIIKHLDMIISVDTSVVHLAGALGIPTWVLLPYVPDWRWLLGREDSPWYPSVRLFRQPSRGDWKSVFELVDVTLRKEIAP